ncbi:MAG: mitochondrial thiamine pyrophosphate transporter [Sarcosagium campestre]|nr:MAG: mitochondrial thiamine pyrophosphate transporter [Sarcosagium campestre]
MSGEEAHLKDEGSRLQVVVAGATAGLVSRFCVAPLDVVKIRLQLQTRHPSHALFKGTVTTLTSIIRDEGFKALWKGNIPAELLYVLYGGIQFGIYRSTTLALQNVSPHVPDAAQSFISGAFAGGIATTATYPLDLLRTRFAAQGTQKVYASLSASIRDIYRHEGPRGYFQGLGAGVGQIVPYMGLFFAAYDTLRSPMNSMSLPFGSSDAAAGVIASVIAKSGVFPLDLVRKRLQVQGPTRSKYAHGEMPTYKGVLSTLMTVVRDEGPRGLYRGLSISLVKAAPAGAVTMWTYERALQILMRPERNDIKV